MNKIIQIKCQSCGSTIKSDDIHGSIVYCKGCHSYKILSESSQTLQPAFYKIYHHPENVSDTNIHIYNFFNGIGDPKVFDNLEVTVATRRYYIPIREILRDGNRHYICLNEKDCSFLEPFIRDNALDKSIVERIIDRRVEADLVSRDLKPIYRPKPENQATFLPIDVDLRRIDAIYEVDHTVISVVKYLPVSVIETNMGVIVSSGPVIFNREQIMANVKECLEKKKESKRKFKETMSALGTLSVIAVVILFLYKLLTMGITVSGFFNAILATVGLVFIGIWAIIWLGLYLIGGVILFAPIILITIFAVNFLKSSEKKSANISESEKGKRLFKIA